MSIYLHRYKLAWLIRTVERLKIARRKIRNTLRWIEWNHCRAENRPSVTFEELKDASAIYIIKEKCLISKTCTLARTLILNSLIQVSRWKPRSLHEFTVVRFIASGVGMRRKQRDETRRETGVNGVAEDGTLAAASTKKEEESSGEAAEDIANIWSLVPPRLTC